MYSEFNSREVILKWPIRHSTPFPAIPTDGFRRIGTPTPSTYLLTEYCRQL